MALRIGVGDAFTLCKGALDLCTSSTLHEDRELHSLVSEMALMRSNLKTLSSQVGDEKAFASSRPDIAPILKRSLEPLYRDLLDAHRALQTYSTSASALTSPSSRKCSMHVVEQIRHHLLHKAKLDGFERRLSVHRESLSAMKDLMGEQSPSDRKASIAKFCGIVEEMERERDKEKKEEQVRGEAVRTIEERMSVSEDVGEEGNTTQMSLSQVLEELEDDLVRNGIDREKAGDHLEPITRALLLPAPAELSLRPSMQTPVFVPFKLDIFESVAQASGAKSKPRGI